MNICPLCNSLKKPVIKCTCGSLMEDKGPAADYFGPYSPYFNMEFQATACHHLFVCPQCGQDTIINAHPEGKLTKKASPG